MTAQGEESAPIRDPTSGTAKWSAGLMTGAVGNFKHNGT
jgi:hypothetical protein